MSKTMNKKLSKAEKTVLMNLAESAVSIPPGEKVGRWTREDRIMVVYSALCAIYRINKNKK